MVCQADPREMTRRILFFLEMNEVPEQFESVHNYINFEDNIIRKGAISAHEGEKMVIPLNMRDGSLIAVGKGSKELELFGTPWCRKEAVEEPG